jgi:hypothetical protein
MLGKKTDCDIIFRAKAHKKRAAGNIAKTDNPPECVNRDAKAYLSFDFHDNSFSLF